MARRIQRTRSTESIAKHFKVKPKTVQGWVRLGLPFKERGEKKFFNLKEVKAWKAERDQSQRTMRSEWDNANYRMRRLLSAEEFVHSLSTNRPDQVRRGKATFLIRHWKDWHYTTGPKSTKEATVEKAFERWKADMRQEGLLVTPDPLLVASLEAGISPEGVYALDYLKLQEATTEAVERFEGLEAARIEAGGKELVGELLSTGEVERALGLTRGKIFKWIKTKKGFPFVRKRGRRASYYTSVEAVERWIHRMCLAGEIRIGPCRPEILDIKDAVSDAHGNLSRAVELLRSRGFYMNYSNLNRIVREVGIPYVTKHQFIEPTDEEIRVAMKDSDDRITVAAEALGISPRVLASLIESRGMKEEFSIRPARVPKGFGPISKKDVFEAMEDYGPRVADAAEALGTSESHLNVLLRKHGLAEKYREQREAIREAEKAEEAAAMRRAIEVGIREGLTQMQVADSLGMNRDTFYTRLSSYGLNELARQLLRQSPVRHRKVHAEHDPSADMIPFWLAALSKVIGESSKAFVASSLGVSRASVTHWSKGKPPSYENIEGVMELARLPMPDWEVALKEIKDAHKTQRQAAESIALTQGQFSKLIRGHEFPSSELLRVILEATGRPYFVPRVSGNPGDTRLRRLERAAAEGNLDAKLTYLREKARRGIDVLDEPVWVSWGPWEKPWLRLYEDAPLEFPVTSEFEMVTGSQRALGWLRERGDTRIEKRLGWRPPGAEAPHGYNVLRYAVPNRHVDVDNSRPGFMEELVERSGEMWNSLLLCMERERINREDLFVGPGSRLEILYDRGWPSMLVRIGSSVFEMNQRPLAPNGVNMYVGEVGQEFRQWPPEDAALVDVVPNHLREAIIQRMLDRRREELGLL